MPRRWRAPLALALCLASLSSGGGGGRVAAAPVSQRPTGASAALAENAKQCIFLYQARSRRTRAQAPCVCAAQPL
jgi:hypothetical protein